MAHYQTIRICGSLKPGRRGAPRVLQSRDGRDIGNEIMSSGWLAIGEGRARHNMPRDPEHIAQDRRVPTPASLSRRHLQFRRNPRCYSSAQN